LAEVATVPLQAVASALGLEQVLVPHDPFEIGSGG
jgi:hypothetical protein